jgi:CheY-like chemotaxis protein
MGSLAQFCGRRGAGDDSPALITSRFPKLASHRIFPCVILMERKSTRDVLLQVAGAFDVIKAQHALREFVASTVLVIEDEILIRMVIVETLRDAGLCVVEAKTADEAMDYIRSGAAVDLLFSDVEMPGTMTGIGLAQKLRVEFPKIAVILTSGGPHCAEAMSIAPFIAKPYIIDNVLAQIRTALTTATQD